MVFPLASATTRQRCAPGPAQRGLQPIPLAALHFLDRSAHAFKTAPCQRNRLQARVVIDLTRGSLGSHTVCVRVDERFLQYSRFRGNDLSTPMPDFGFPGLNPGDSWCLCAARWLEAYEQNMAPKVYLTRTHKRALEIVGLGKLKELAVDLN